jgi:DNA-binding response OmpR family regulator
MSDKSKVLMAEDDESLGFLIKDNLQEAGYDVDWCLDGEVALKTFQNNKYDIVLLDVMMPNKDGFETAKKIRAMSDIVPILFLTAKSMEEDKLKGFKLGGDDYITKPFSIKELLARVEVFLRRTKKLENSATKEYQIGKLRFVFNDLKIYNGEAISGVTQKEAELLRFFCEHPNQILKREEVLLNVWGKDDYFLGRSMDVFITKLRKHFKADPTLLLETIHGIGFRFNIGLQ